MRSTRRESTLWKAGLQIDTEKIIRHHHQLSWTRFCWLVPAFTSVYVECVAIVPENFSRLVIIGTSTQIYTIPSILLISINIFHPL